jgi:pectin methylesterase-like acyl-CoA thioesterase
LSGTTDGSGTLTITATGPAGGNPWWQTYLNGLQLQIGGTAPSILGLANQTVEDGTTVILNPVVTGNPVPTYQWYENGTNLPGQTSPSLTLTSVTTNQNGNVYSLVAANAIGVASNSMTLTVNPSAFSTLTVTAVTPTNGATDICSDTPLTVTFSSSISLGSIGSIKIYDAANPGTPVDTINAAAGPAQQRTFPGDNQSFTYPTFSISGNTVKINPHFNVLTADRTYYVTIDPKTFLDAGGTNFVGLTDTNAWRFSTKSPPADPDHVVVNGDGSGDFLTVQGAVNSVPNANTTPKVINIRDGLYQEIVNISAKHNLTLRGQSRTGTRVGFANNSTYQAANGGTTHARMAFKVNANDIYVESLSLTNLTPQGGSQAEALMLESGARRFICNDVTIASRQDTILANINTSQGYFHNSRIEGNFDYIWGGGNLFFTNCTVHTIAGSSSFNVTAARTTTAASSSTNFPWLNPGGTYTANGMSFVNCSYTADAGVTTVTLAGGNGTAGNNVSWFNCDFSPKYVNPPVLFSGNYLFWQAENTQNGSPVNFANITPHAGTDAEMLAATNVTVWLYGWTPQLVPPTPNPPVISAPTVLGDGNFQFNATGDNGQAYRVWATTNVTLTPVTSTWSQIGSGTFGSGPEIITDSSATNFLQRYYLLTVP